MCEQHEVTTGERIGSEVGRGKTEGREEEVEKGGLWWRCLERVLSNLALEHCLMRLL